MAGMLRLREAKVDLGHGRHPLESLRESKTVHDLSGVWESLLAPDFQDAGLTI